MANQRRSYQAIALVIIVITAFGLITTEFTTASCSTTQTGNTVALDTLRRLTHGTAPPNDAVLAKFEVDKQDATAGALARLARAELKVRAKDYAAAAELLDSDVFADHTLIEDYALFTRATALEKLNRQTEARALYEQLARRFPRSLLAAEATIRAAEIALNSGAASAVPLFLKDLIEEDNPAALLLAAQAYEKDDDTANATKMLRRIRFYAPASEESATATASLTRLNPAAASVVLAPATSDEALARAERLLAAKRYADAATAFTEAFARFPALATPERNVQRGIALAGARRTDEAISALRSVPLSAGETHAEALHHLALLHARGRLFDAARGVTEELRRLYPNSNWNRDALVAAGDSAKAAKNTFQANNFYRSAVALFPNDEKVAGAQFEIAWAAHEAGNFAESSRLLIEHLANYADRNTDNRGRAGYWAARDAERAGKIAEAQALYAALLTRYDANWYGYLAKDRLDKSRRNAIPDSAVSQVVSRAAANLKTITVGEETIGAAETETLTRANQLAAAGFDEWAFAELDELLDEHSTSPRLNLAIAQLHAVRNEPVLAFSALRRSYPDYSQMEPEEMTQAEWSIFYPLNYWSEIQAAARARNLDAYTVAGLIRQESVFNPRAVSSAKAYGLMQLLVPTGQLVARRYGINESINATSLFNPSLNIKLGTGYMRDQFNSLGKLEYVAAAYNAGPGRAVRWRRELPAEIDEWAEAIPFRETRGYVQGVVRNMLQYKRLYDEQGRFRSNVGARPVRPPVDGMTTQSNGTTNLTNSNRPRRVTENQPEEER